MAKTIQHGKKRRATAQDYKLIDLIKAALPYLSDADKLALEHLVVTWANRAICASGAA